MEYSDMKQQKIALITGTAKENGLGFNAARFLGQQGVVVIPTARKAEEVKRLEKTFADRNIQAYPLVLDLTDDRSLDLARDFIESKFSKLDILINNAALNIEGAGGGESKLPSQTPVADFRKTFETNVLGTINLTQKLLPLIKKSPQGRIVNVSSCLGSLSLHSDPESWMYNFKLPSYDMSKTALNLWTVELAWELRETAIKVNSAHPGWVKTDMGGSEAPMEIEDGIKTLVQLATLPDNGPSAGFYHLGERLPW